MEAGPHRRLVPEVEAHAPAVVPVEGLGHHRVSDPRGRSGGVGLGLHNFAFWHGEPGGRQQGGGQLLVAGDVDGQRRGLRGDGCPDPFLVHALAELDQRLLVEADVGDIALDRLVDQGLGGGAEGGPFGEPHQALHLGQEVEGRLGLDQVVDQTDRQPAGGESHVLLDVAVDDVVDARLAGAAGFAPRDLPAGLVLQL